MRHLILKIKESGMPYKCSRSCLETVMSMLRGLRKKENSSSICIGCSFFKFLSVKAVRFFLCKVEQGSIIKSVFLYNFKCSNMEIGKTDESLRRKATGPVKWQPVA